MAYARVDGVAIELSAGASEMLRAS